MTTSLLRKAPQEAVDPSDADLAARVARGDHPAFEALMRRHNRALFRTARAILRDDAEAEDALQEAYLQAYHTIGSYRGEARLSTWLARVVANEALMRLRKQARRSAIIPLQPGVAVEETAAILQIPDATVRSRFFRARSLLREGLAAEVDLACGDAFGFAGERCDRVVAGVMKRLSQ